MGLEWSKLWTYDPHLVGNFLNCLIHHTLYWKGHDS